MFVIGQTVQIQGNGLAGRFGVIKRIEPDIFGSTNYHVRLSGEDDTWSFFESELKLVTGRGGARPNAGRPIDPNRPKKQTKVVRLPEDVAAKLDYLIELEALVEQYRQDALQGSQTSPRWQKLRDFLEDAATVKLVNTFELAV